MPQEHWFQKREAYQPLLEGFGITEAEYYAAAQEVANLFSPGKAGEYYHRTLTKLRNLIHFELVPYANQRSASHTCL